MVNNYGGNFTSFSEYLQQNQVRQDRQRYPFYDDNADYNTNSKSYYDDLARKQKLFEILAKRIWEYDEELAKRFEEWDKNLEDFPDDVKDLLIKWLEDGTLEEIIGDEFEKFKNKILYLINDLNINKKPTITHSLDSTLPLQSFLHDEKGISTIRLEPKKVTSEDDYRILKFSHSGDRYDSMKIQGGSHLENIGFKDGWYYSPIFSSDGKNVKIISFKFESKKTIKYSDEDNNNLKSHNINLKSKKININIFKDKINIMCWLGLGKGVNIKQYDIDEFNNKKYNPIIDLTVAQENKDLDWIQGCVATNELIYIATGNYVYGDDKYITVYDLKNGDIVEKRDITYVGNDDTNTKAINNWIEPEGMNITTNEDGTYNLHLGVFTGGSINTKEVPTNKRYKIYTWTPISNQDKLINGELLAQVNLATKDRLIFYGDVTGDSKNTYHLMGTLLNYKFLSFIFTTGSIGTHSVTVPTQRFKFANYISLQNNGITSEGKFYSYDMTLEFENKNFTDFKVKHARGIEVNFKNLESSGGTYDNHEGIHLYHIIGTNETPHQID